MCETPRVLIAEAAFAVNASGAQNLVSAAARPRYSVLGSVAWPAQGLTPMRDWQVDLSDAIKEKAVISP